MHKILHYILVITTILLCCAKAQAQNPAPLKVVTGLIPFKTFVEQIGGEQVEVFNLLEAGTSAHSYTPTPRALARIMKSSVYFSSGMLFEQRIISKLSSSASHIEFVDTIRGIKIIEGHDCGSCSHDNGNAGDIHVWMSPANAIIICTNIEEALSRIDEPNKAYYQRNCLKYIQELQKTDQLLKEQLAPLKGKGFYVYHPALGYFADRYELIQIPIESGGREPSGRQLGNLIRQAKGAKVTTVFVQRDFPQAAARKLAQTISGTIQIVDPLAGDYCENLLHIGKSIARSVHP